MKIHVLALTTLACAILHAQSPDPIGFIEEWVLSSDREATLSKLVPGTDDYFFYHSLHYQQTRQKKKFDTTMKVWEMSLKNKTVHDYPLFEVMKNRQIILDYERDPKKCIDELIHMLDLHLDHKRPIPPEDAKIPSTLDPALISTDAFLKEAAKEGKIYESFRGYLIPLELKHAKSFDRAKRLWFLKNIKRADFPGVTQLILAELKEKKHDSFSRIPGTQHLTLDQLIKLEKQHPALRNDASFITARLIRMRPGDASFLLHHPDQKLPWLTTSWKYTSQLPPKFNSLKAHILYHLLETHIQNDSYPEDLFLSFLRLPHRSEHLKQQKNLPNAANLARDFSSITTLPPVRNATPLIESYLHHLLGKKTSSADYSRFFPKAYLTRIHAEAQLMAGADPSTWGKYLAPEAFRALRERTEVSLAPSNKSQYSATDSVAIALDLKNTPRLTVRIFELDALAHIRRTGSDPSVTIKLNGLVPHHTQNITFNQPALVRHRYSLKLPQLKGRGSWIVECISQGASCRFLVRKGSLQLVTRAIPGAQEATILDEHQNPVFPATLWINGKPYPTSKNGTVLIPLTSVPRTDHAILYAPQPGGSGLATATHISRLSSHYQLKISTGTHSEQLLAGKTARIYIHPLLTNNNQKTPLSTLKKTTLHITATLRGDISTELSDISVNIPDTGIISLPISIPEDVRSITVALSGEIPMPANQSPIKLNSSTTIKINGINDTPIISQPLLALTTNGWKIDLLGRNGEPLSGRVLNIAFSRDGFLSNVTHSFRTDTNGQIHLGSLKGINKIKIEATDFSSALSESISTISQSLPDTIHALQGESIRIPLPHTSWANNIHLHCGLFLHHGEPDTPVADMHKHLSVSNNEIVIRDLPAGDYSLRFSDFTSPLPIHIIDGKKNGAWVSDTTQSLEHSNPMPLHIPKINVKANTLTAQIIGNLPNIHVVAVGSRYFINDNHFNLFSIHPDNHPARWIHAFLGNEMLNGRTLSDEYRYILERRNARHFPGNMLPRPGLILNRWKLDFSEGLLDHAQGGARGVPMAMRKRSKKGGTTFGAPAPPSASSSPCLDFLAHSAVIKVDLKVSPDGTLTLPLKDFNHCQSITLVAATDTDSTTRTIALTPKKLSTRERRLDRNLDPSKHYSGTRATAILTKGASAKIVNVLDADWRAYTSLGHVYDYFHANTADPHLREFILLMQWPKLSDAQRKNAAHLLASHEFHLFAYFKDRQWFNTHIKPILVNKRHRTFIDNYLLGSDLTPYLSPWRYRMLNAAEKALLARSLPAHKSAIIQDLTQFYATRKPNPETETLLFTSALKQNSLALRDRLGFSSLDLTQLDDAERRLSSVSYLQSKLNTTIIPRISLENTSFGEAIDFLRLRTHELDTDPTSAEINFAIKGQGISQRNIDSLKVKNIPLGTALQYICDKTHTRYRITPHAIEFSSLDDVQSDDLYIRTIIVPRGLMASLRRSNNDDDDDDPFTATDEKLLPTRLPLKQILKMNGVSFPADSSVTYNPMTSTIVVRNTPGNLDMIEQMITPLRCAGSPRPSRGITAPGGGRAPLIPTITSTELGYDTFPGDNIPRNPAPEPDDRRTPTW